MQTSSTVLTAMENIKTIFKTEHWNITNFKQHNHTGIKSIDAAVAKEQEASVIIACNNCKAFNKLGYKFVSLTDYLENYVVPKQKYDTYLDLIMGDIVCITPDNTCIFLDLKVADKKWVFKQYVGTITKSSYDAFTRDCENKLYLLSSANARRFFVISAEEIRSSVKTGELTFTDNAYIKGMDIAPY